MNEENRDEAVNSTGSELPFPLSRRAVLGAAVVALGAIASEQKAFATPLQPASPPTTEGFFLLYRANGAENLKDRLFFIRSEWLGYFEITDLYDQFPDDTASKGKPKIRGLFNGGKKWEVLYSDDIGSQLIQLDIPVSDMPPPLPGTTYVAMSISPS